MKLPWEIWAQCHLVSGLQTSKISVVGAVTNCSVYLRERRRESRIQNKDKHLFSDAGEMRREKMMQVKKCSKCSCWDTCLYIKALKISSSHWHAVPLHFPGCVILLLKAESEIWTLFLFAHNRESEWTLSLLKFVIMVQTQWRYSHSLDVAGSGDKTSIFCTHEQKDYKIPICEHPANSQTSVYLKEKHF